MHQNIEEAKRLVSSGQIKYVLFDLDGTLYESSAGIEAQLRDAMVAQAARFLGLKLDEARVLLRTYRMQYKASVLGLEEHHGVNPEEFYEAVYDSLDASAMQMRPGSVEALKDLAGHIPIGVFTNSNRSFTHRTISYLGLDEVFERIVTVEDHGFIRKPEREAYERMFTSLGLAPEQVLMFDDIASSLEVMNSMGAHGVLVSNGLRAHPRFVDLHTNIEHDSAPDYVLASSHDIVGFISELNDALIKEEV